MKRKVVFVIITALLCAAVFVAACFRLWDLMPDTGEFSDIPSPCPGVGLLQHHDDSKKNNDDTEDVVPTGPGTEDSGLSKTEIIKYILNDPSVKNGVTFYLTKNHNGESSSSLCFFSEKTLRIENGSILGCNGVVLAFSEQDSVVVLDTEQRRGSIMNKNKLDFCQLPGMGSQNLEEIKYYGEEDIDGQTSVKLYRIAGNTLFRYWVSLDLGIVMKEQHETVTAEGTDITTYTVDIISQEPLPSELFEVPSDIVIVV